MKDKILENRGITIIHALVGVLIFGVISSIIYSSTAANLNSLKTEAKYQQSYLTVSSAAEAFVEGIVGDYAEYVVGVNTNIENRKGFIQSSFVYKDYGMKNPLYIEEGSNHGMSSDMLTMYLSSSTGTITRDYTISVNGSSSVIESVKVEYCMASDYTIYANFYLASGSVNDNYYMRVKIPVKEQDYEHLHFGDFSAEVAMTEAIVPAITDPDLGFSINRKDYYHITYDATNVVFEKGKYDFTKL